MSDNTSIAKPSRTAPRGAPVPRRVLARYAEVGPDHIELFLLAALVDEVESPIAKERFETRKAEVAATVAARALRPRFWRVRPVHLLQLLADTDPTAAHDAVISALDRGLCCDVLAGHAGYVVSIDRYSGVQALRRQLHDSFPDFFPTAELKARIMSAYPRLEPAEPRLADHIEDGCERLAAEYLFVVKHGP